MHTQKHHICSFNIFHTLTHCPPHYILEDSNFDFRYVRLCDIDILREKWLNYLQTVETLIRRHILQTTMG